MSHDPTPRTPEQHDLVGPFRVLTHLSGNERAGCGVVLGPDGRENLARWCPREDAAQRGRLIREYQAMLETPDVAVPRPVLLAEDSSRVYMLRQFMDGVSLVEASPVDRVAWAESLARLVERIGVAGWVHGDISPKNVLVQPDGTAALIDWELAVREGEAGAPGTLGWTPPRAWDGDFVAVCENDRYAAAVTIWELFTSARAFHGGRDEVVRAQRTLCLLPPCGVGERAAALFHGDSTSVVNAVIDDTRRMCTDAVRVGTSAASQYGAELASRIAQQVSASRLTEVTSDVSVPSPVTVHAARALAVHWMLSGRGPAVVLSDCFDGAEDWKSCGGTEQLRACRIALTAMVAHQWHGRLLAIVDPRAMEALVMDEGGNDWAKAASRLLGPSEQPRVIVRLSASVTSESTTEFVHGVVRAVLGPGAVPGVSSRALAGSALDLPLLIRDLHTRGYNALSEQRPNPGRESDAAGFSQADLPRMVRRCETSIVEGQLSRAYRECVRATTMLGGQVDVQDSLVIRLAECWKEIGNTHAAVATADRIRCESTRASTLLAHAATFDDANALKQLLDRVPLHIEHAIARDRALATWNLYCQRPAAALRLLRGVRLRRLRGDPRALIAHCLLLLSALRALDREPSAARCHRVALSACRAAGTPREQWLCEFGGLLVRVGRRGNPRSCEWAALAESARRLSLWRDARRTQIRALRAMVDEGQFEAAIAKCSEIEAAGSGALETIVGGAAIVARAKWSAADHLERWQSAGERDIGPDSEVSVVQRLLRRECEGNWGVSVSTGSGDRSFMGRLVRVLGRIEGGGRHAERAWRCLRFAQRRRADLPGCALQAARGVLCSEWLGGSALDLMAAARNGTSSDEPVATELSVAIVVVAAAWGREIDPDVAQWALSLRTGFPGGRAAGVRGWEWHLGTHALECQTAERPYSRSVIIEAMEMARRLTEELPTPSRAVYETRVRRLWQWSIEAPQAGPTAQRVAPRGGSEIAREFRAGSVNEGLDEALRRCVTIAMDRSGSERGVIIFDRGDGRPRAKVVGRSGSSDESDVQICHSVLTRAEEHGSVLVIDDAVGDPTLAERPSVKRFNTRSVAVVPIGTGTRRLGYLYLETRSSKRSLGHEEVEELALAGEEVAAQLELAALRDECRSLARDRDRLAAQADRSGELVRLGQHVGEVVHELRNALTVVAGEAELACMAVASPAETARALQVIQRQALDGVGMLRSLLDLIRGGSGAERERVDPYAVAEEVLLAIRGRVIKSRSCGAEVTIQLTGCRGLSILCVASELREVLQNLVSNAIDAMPRGGRLTVDVAASGDRVRVAVSDTGVGMDAMTLEHAFDPFFSTKGRQGNGLGLAICKSIVNRHDGFITANSVVGEGTVFTLSFPRLYRTDNAASLLDAVERSDASERRA